ncbi:PspC domain-containing protein [Solitalea koreensis]|uniref:Phage shock protein C (PspC) family protein n=1 Tax=Solitalea koreensis TaxID=543615 RepID=A0A521D9P7_9SPHI|nr:PspC domain-containing protein [Solitalea koreensis]SMO68332.1 phage shock protein C (PspC) family protein [Solitalea koreensis]
MFQRIICYFEHRSFGVCSYLADRFNVSLSKLRLFFIYSSFLAVGFPIIFYLLAAIVLDIRRYFKFNRRTNFWEN